MKNITKSCRHMAFWGAALLIGGTCTPALAQVDEGFQSVPEPSILGLIVAALVGGIIATRGRNKK